MELRFSTPDLRRLDLFVGEMIVACVPENERPPRGTAGLLDFRLLGAISRRLTDGSFSGKLGEHLILRPRPRLPFDRLLLIGMGSTETFNPQIYAAIVEQILTLLREASVRRAVVELPGRAAQLIDPELAVNILLERAASTPLMDTWTLIEPPEVAKQLSTHRRRDPAGGWGVRR